MCSAAAGEGGKARGLPSGVHLSDLMPTKTEPIGPTHDEGNPEMHCEFFDTRQARSHIHPLSPVSTPTPAFTVMRNSFRSPGACM